MELNSLGKIIVVDDSSAIRAFFCGALQSLNFEIQSFSNPILAIEHLKNNHVDCILSDFEMPEINGLEFCKQIKSNPLVSHIPFVILSMHDSDKFIMECLAAGADDYLPKKTNPEIILAKVKLMIEVSKHREVLKMSERKKTFEATVASLNHEWNNLASIIYPILDTLVLKTDSIEDEKTIYTRLKKSLERVLKIIENFNNVKSVSFEQYTHIDGSLMVKMKDSNN